MKLLKLEEVPFEEETSILQEDAAMELDITPRGEVSKKSKRKKKGKKKDIKSPNKNSIK